MAKNKSLLSYETKLRFADELGYGDVVRREGGFANLPSKVNGQLVKLAIQRAEQILAAQAGQGRA